MTKVYLYLRTSADGEREVVRRILKMRAKGESVYAIAKTLNDEGTRTRYGKEFKVQTVQNILARQAEAGVLSQGK